MPNKLLKLVYELASRLKNLKHAISVELYYIHTTNYMN
jgi:hypothetical protein